MQTEPLVLLVGSNPLPNYLAATTLQPRRVLLLFTPDTRDPKDRLTHALRTRLEITDVDAWEIVDGMNALAVRERCAGLLTGTHLNYTGGTKVMAAHVRMAFRDQGGTDDRASYVDEREGILRTDDPRVRLRPLVTDRLDLEALLILHGLERGGKSARSAATDPTANDADVTASACVATPSIARDLFARFSDEQGKRLKPAALKGDPFKPEASGLSLSQSVIPGEKWSNRQVDPWVDFFRGIWLEPWVAAKVRAVVGASATVDVGLELTRDGRALELDIVVIRGHRLYLLSCTTDSTLKMCKSKLFEAALRARQVGGDLARCALVSMLDGGDADGRYADHLRKDIASTWEAPNTPCLFALADLREWAGIDRAVDLSSLKTWLDS
jgi:hypothetical protein